VAAGFHLLALWGLWGGWKAIGELAALEEHGGAESIESLRQRMLLTQDSRSSQISTTGRKVIFVLVGLIIVLCVATLFTNGYIK
ncbi:MAG TPA: hypothetical protein VGJ97_05955, partial [Anaerolineaceae bacterium]